MLKRFTQALDRLIYRMANTTLRGVFTKSPHQTNNTQPVPEIERPRNMAGWLTFIAYSLDSPNLRRLGYLMARATTVDTYSLEGVANTHRWGQETTRVFVSKVFPMPRLLREALDSLNEICALVVSPEGLVYCSKRPGEVIGVAAFHSEQPNGDHTVVGDCYISVRVYRTTPSTRQAQGTSTFVVPCTRWRYGRWSTPRSTVQVPTLPARHCTTPALARTRQTGHAQATGTGTAPAPSTTRQPVTFPTWTGTGQQRARALRLRDRLEHPHR